MTTNEIFITMVDWIVDNTEMRNPTEILKKAGLDTANYSKIKSGTNKSVKYQTMKQLNNAFGKPFNPEWMRGMSDVMLVDDLAKTSVAVPDADAMTVLLSAKDETIAAQQALIDNLQQQLADLRAQLSFEKESQSAGTL